MAEKNNQKLAQFRVNRVKELENMYADEASTARRYDRSNSSSSANITTAAQVRDAINKSINNRTTVVKLSKELYAKNPIYMQVIDYLSNMFMWRYKVTPHKVYTKSKAKAKKVLSEDDYKIIYHLMLEVVDGLSIETKFPALLNYLFIEGAVYFTTISDPDSITIETLLLPNKYCRKIGETQYGTALIQFDFSYFDDLGLLPEDLKQYLNSFSDEFKKGYNRYKKDSTNMRWQDLDPHFSSGILLNQYSIPTYLYILGGILDYEKYQDNELERNENTLRKIVVQTMPHYEDRLIFEVDEVKALHKSMKKVIEKGEKTRLITTYGDIKVEQLSDNEISENQVLSKAFKAIFNNAGFNSGIFTADSVTALEMSLVRDKGLVWKYVQALLNFYTIAINNWFDFKSYQADIDILPISPYTYNDDIKTFKDNATLGVGKIDYFIASGIKQKNIEDMLELEQFLHLDRITPMQTSYTQTAVDRESTEDDADKSNKTSKEAEEKESEIEPSEENTEADKEENKD